MMDSKPRSGLRKRGRDSATTSMKANSRKQCRVRRPSNLPSAPHHANEEWSLARVREELLQGTPISIVTEERRKKVTLVSLDLGARCFKYRQADGCEYLVPSNAVLASYHSGGWVFLNTITTAKHELAYVASRDGLAGAPSKTLTGAYRLLCAKASIPFSKSANGRTMFGLPREDMQRVIRAMYDPEYASSLNTLNDRVLVARHSSPNSRDFSNSIPVPLVVEEYGEPPGPKRRRLSAFGPQESLDQRPDIDPDEHMGERAFAHVCGPTSTYQNLSGSSTILLPLGPGNEFTELENDGNELASLVAELMDESDEGYVSEGW